MALFRRSHFLIAPQTTFLSAPVSAPLGIRSFWSGRKTKRGVKPIPYPRNGDTVESFLRVIGRNCDAHVSKFKDWDHLFSATSTELKELGLSPPERKNVLVQADNYRNGVAPTFVPAKKERKAAIKFWLDVYEKSKKAKLEKQTEDELEVARRKLLS